MTETEIQKLIDKRKTEMTDSDDLVDEVFLNRKFLK